MTPEALTGPVSDLLEDYRPTYWNDRGRFQRQLQELYALIPSRGVAGVAHLDLVRCCGNIYYDWFNNGGCNFDIRRDDINRVRSDWKLLTPFVRELDEHFPGEYEGAEFLIRGYARRKDFTDRDYDLVMDVVVFYASLVHGREPKEPA